MTTLKELLGQGEKRQAVIKDACEVLDLEVAGKSGLSGMAIKGAFGVVKNIKPGFITEVVDGLLDDFLEALEPINQAAVAAQASPGDYMRSHGSDAANALLAVTDRRVERAQRAVIKKTYSKLRPTAEKHVEAATPRLAGLLDRQLAS